MDERQVGHGSFQALLRLAAQEQDFTPEAAQLIAQHALKPGTLRGYDGVIQQFSAECRSAGIATSSPRAAAPGFVGEFLRRITAQSQRPHSQLRQARAALSQFFAHSGRDNPFENHMLQRLIRSLERSGTKRGLRSAPLVDYKVILKGLEEVYEKWQKTGDVRHLRLVLIVLFALFGLVRSEDLAKIKVCDCRVAEVVGAPPVLVVDMLNFKNDYDMEGDELRIPGSSNPAWCAAHIFSIYRKETSTIRESSDTPLIIALTSASPISASAIGSEKSKFLKSIGIRAKSYNNAVRTAGVRYFLDNGMMVPDVMKQGRWRGPETFQNHYVRKAIANDFVEKSTRKASPPALLRRPEQMTSTPSSAKKAALTNLSEISTPSLSSADVAQTTSPWVSPIPRRPRSKRYTASLSTTPSVSSSESFSPSSSSSFEAPSKASRARRNSALLQ